MTSFVLGICNNTPVFKIEEERSVYERILGDRCVDGAWVRVVSWREIYFQEMKGGELWNVGWHIHLCSVS